jgi:hypothetical protein
MSKTYRQTYAVRLTRALNLPSCVNSPRVTALGSCMMCPPFLYQHRGVNGGCLVKGKYGMYSRSLNGLLEQNSSSETNSHPQIPLIYKPKFPCLVRKNPSLDRILSQMNPGDFLHPIFCSIHCCCSMYRSLKRFLFFKFPTKISYTFLTSSECATRFWGPILLELILSFAGKKKWVEIILPRGQQCVHSNFLFISWLLKKNIFKKYA